MRMTFLLLLSIIMYNSISSMSLDETESLTTGNHCCLGCVHNAVNSSASFEGDIEETGSIKNWGRKWISKKLEEEETKTERGKAKKSFLREKNNSLESLLAEMDCIERRVKTEPNKYALILPELDEMDRRVKIATKEIGDDDDRDIQLYRLLKFDKIYIRLLKANITMQKEYTVDLCKLKDTSLKLLTFVDKNPGYECYIKESLLRDFNPESGENPVQSIECQIQTLLSTLEHSRQDQE